MRRKVVFVGYVHVPLRRCATCSVCGHVTHQPHSPIESTTRSERDGDVEKMEDILNIEAAALELVKEQLITKESGFSKDDVVPKIVATRFWSGGLWVVRLVVVRLVVPFIYRYCKSTCYF
ncbi:hypothetical protein AMECASPLE_036708 [Ameca splendens]|uniref:Uncharacterized protein n=1 Tax=Ameca splendens TaxID=208324 RepID=A0ABV1AE49_9TELE